MAGKKTTTNQKPIRVGVIGVGRGQSFASAASDVVGMKLVALCDVWKDRLEETGKKYGVATYTDFDKFLSHDMDAVVLANFFHQHAPFAIKALAAGKHVMSETAACTTMAEGVALCRAVEKSKRTYMFAENYPYMLGPQEMRRLYLAGEIGAVRYAEGEYNHAMEESGRLRLSPGEKHWRNWLPPTYYCSHALAPLMYMTDTMPVSVNGVSIVEEQVQTPRNTKVSDVGGVMLVRMHNGAIFRIWGLMQSSIHRVRYELHGERGVMTTNNENRMGGYVRVGHEHWFLKPGQPRERTYLPEWPEHGDLAAKAGHGGGDFWTNYHFASAIRAGNQPYLNVYRGVAMCATGIQGWRSAMQNGAPVEIPDFSKESARKKYENDHWSPWPDGTGDGQAPPSLRGAIKPSAAALKKAWQVWKAMGYKE